MYIQYLDFAFQSTVLCAMDKTDCTNEHREEDNFCVSSLQRLHCKFVELHCIVLYETKKKHKTVHIKVRNMRIRKKLAFFFHRQWKVSNSKNKTVPQLITHLFRVKEGVIN